VLKQMLGPRELAISKIPRQPKLHEISARVPGRTSLSTVLLPAGGDLCIATYDQRFSSSSGGRSIRPIWAPIIQSFTFSVAVGRAFITGPTQLLL